MKIKKAIIPVAGWGTRRLPITKVIEKSMLPIGNRPLVDYIVEEPVRVQHVLEQAADDYHRHEMRDVCYRLDGPFEILHADFVNEQREDYRRREPENEVVKIDKHRVPDEPPSVGTAQKIDKMAETNPGTAGKSQRGLVILKGDYRSAHGNIMENDIVSDHGKEHQVDILVSQEIAIPPLPERFFCYCQFHLHNKKPSTGILGMQFVIFISICYIC